MNVMPKKQDPHNEKRYTLKPLTTKKALKKAMQAGDGKANQMVRRNQPRGRAKGSG